MYQLLDKRNSCPCCNKTYEKCVFSLSYKDNNIKSFLKSYYGYEISNFFSSLENYNYNLILCKNCNTIYQEYIPSIEFSIKLYNEIMIDEQTLQKKKKFSIKNFKEYFNELYAFENLLKKKSYDIKILEFGAGWGYWSRCAASMNFNIYAHELSQSKKNYIKNQNINILESLKNRNQNFDIIYSNQTFEHLNFPREIIIDLLKLLKPGGYIYLKFPNSYLFKYKIKKSNVIKKGPLQPLEHLNLFSKKSFEMMMKDFDTSIFNLDHYYDMSIQKIPRILKNYFSFKKILIKKNK